MRNYVFIFFIFCKLVLLSQNCADKLFLNIDFKKTAGQICNQLKNDTNYNVLNTYRQHKTGWEGILAKYKNPDDIYSVADSIYLDIAWGWIMDAPKSLNRLTKNLAIHIYLKDEKAVNELLFTLKNKICKGIDFDNQHVFIEEGYDLYGDGSTYFLSNSYYPQIIFLKMFSKQKHYVYVSYNDFN